MAIHYSEKNIEKIQELEKKYAPYHGLLDCSRVIFLSEYFRAKSGEKGLIMDGTALSSSSGRFTIEAFLEAFNCTMHNGVCLSSALSTVKRWLSQFEAWNGENEYTFFQEVDIITCFLLDNPFVTEDLFWEMQRSIGEKIEEETGKKGYRLCKMYDRKGWTAYILSKYLHSKFADSPHQFSTATCTAALRRLYLIDARTASPQTVGTITFKELHDALEVNFISPEATRERYHNMMDLAKDHNIQDLFNTLMRGEFVFKNKNDKERYRKIEILTWYPTDGGKMYYKYYKKSGQVESDYFTCEIGEDTFKADTDTSENGKGTPKRGKYLWDSLSASLGLSASKGKKGEKEKADLLLLNRRDFLAPLVAYHFRRDREKYNHMWDEILLLDFCER